MPTAKSTPEKPVRKVITEDQLRCKVEIAVGFLDRNVPSHSTFVKLPDVEEADRWKSEFGQGLSMVPPEIAVAYERALLNAANLVADYFGGES